MLNITAIIVSYNTAGLLRHCYESLRRFYPDLPVIIIDGSHHANECFQYSKSLAGPNTTVTNVERNIGHGPGMVLGLEKTKTKYALLIDSDVKINHPGSLEAMMFTFQNPECPGLYGIGQVVQVNESGSNVPAGIPYLHPHFALISVEAYFKNHPFIHHGAPLIQTMTHLEATGYYILDFDPKKYVTHLGRGTRMLNPPDFSPAKWDKPKK